MATARETLQGLINLEIDLIPLHPGGKIPSKKQWQIPVTRSISSVISSFPISSKAPAWDDPVEEFTKQIANIGLLNEPSRIVTLDCDSPHAGAALQAACKALGGDINTLYPAASWRSVKGSKAMYRRPKDMPAGRAWFRVFRGGERSKYDVIFELRGTGQDVLPPSFREDHNVHLAWFDGPPHRIEEMPGWLVKTYHQLIEQKGVAFDAMLAALDLTPDQIKRTMETPQSATRYPDALAAHTSERAYVNGHYDVEVLLTRYGYVRIGKRWRPSNSHHPTGIVPPKVAGQLWLCEHDNDDLAGVFDAWRAVVVYEFGGDAAAAAASVRAEQKKALVAATQPRGLALVGGTTVQGAVGAQQTQERPATERSLPEQPPPRSAAQPAKEKHPAAQGKGGHPPGGSKAHVSSGAIGKSRLSQAGRVQQKPIFTGMMRIHTGGALVMAMPKAGKSIWVTCAAVAAMTGYRDPKGLGMCGIHTAMPVPVLYCALDEGVEEDVIPRMRRLLTKHNLYAGFDETRLHLYGHVNDLLNWTDAQGIDLSDPLPMEEKRDDLNEKQLAERKDAVQARFAPHTRALYHYIKGNGIKVAVIDTVISLRSAVGQHGKSVYVQDKEEFEAINKIGLALDCVIFATHHTNKEAGGRHSSLDIDPGSKVSGTNATGGSMRTLVYMLRIPGIEKEVLHAIEPVGKKVVMETQQRVDEDMPMGVFSLTSTPVNHPDTGEPDGTAPEWVYACPFGDLLGRDERQFILNWLHEQPPGDWFTAKQIQDAAITASVITGRQIGTFLRYLHRMKTPSTAHPVPPLVAKQGRGGGFNLNPVIRKAMDAERPGKSFTAAKP